MKRCRLGGGGEENKELNKSVPQNKCVSERSLYLSLKEKEKYFEEVSQLLSLMDLLIQTLYTFPIS